MFTFFESQPHTRSTGELNQGLLTLTHEERQAFALLGLKICSIIQNDIQAFWGLESQWQFQGAWHRIPKLWQKEGLLTVAGSLPRNSDTYDPIAMPYSVYANHAFYEELLTFSFGERKQKMYRATQLTTLESFILHEFLGQWVPNALNTLIPEAVELSSERPVHMDGFMTYVFTPKSNLNLHSDFIGKLMLQVPLSALKAVIKHVNPLPTQTWESFLDWNQSLGASFACPVTLVAGLSTLKISELKQLEAGDLIVLEHSDIHRLGLKHPQSQILQAFKIGGDLSTLEQFDPAWASSSVTPPTTSMSLDTTCNPYYNNTQEFNESYPTMMYPHTQVPSDVQNSLWDQLHVDVHAEFKPLRIPIQELRHMSKGLLIEVGDLLHNEVQLVTNSSTIAYGQLVVVGDKFGVLLTKVPGQEDTHALAPLGEEEAPFAPVSIAGSKSSQSHSNEEAMIEERTMTAHHENHDESDEDEDEDAPNNKGEDASDIDPQLVAYCRSIGLHPKLAQTAVEVGFTLQDLVDAATQQGIGMNEFFVAAFEQNDIPVPELDEEDELTSELNRTTAMMEEMEDLLGE
jgi:flagellar motor switch protein FliN/FliY